MSLQIKYRRLALPQMRVSTSSKWIGYLSILSILATLMVLFHNETIGQGLIVLYGIFAIVTGLKSEESFMLTLASFGVVIFATIFNIDELAQQFSTYAFLFICIGLICAVKERLHSYSDVLIKSYIVRSRPRNNAPKPKGKRVFIDRRLR